MLSSKHIMIFETTGNSPAISGITPDLAGRISKLEMMYEVSEGDIDDIVQPRVHLTHTNELKTTNLTNPKTNPTKKHQENDATLPLVTHKSSLQ